MPDNQGITPKHLRDFGNMPDNKDELREKLAEYIYEATRVEAEWSKRPIVPELWRNRDDKFRNQFVEIIAKYMSMDKLPTPTEAHESWNQSYYKMGWKYGEVRDVEAKTHPDLVPFDELSQPEKDKDAIFLAFVWLATQLTDLTNAYNRNQLKSLKAKLPEKVLKKPDPPHHKNKYPVRACISHNFKNFRCTNCGGIQASYDTGLDDKQIGRNEVIDQVNKILDEMIGE